MHAHRHMHLAIADGPDIHPRSHLAPATAAAMSGGSIPGSTCSRSISKTSGITMTSTVVPVTHVALPMPTKNFLAARATWKATRRAFFVSVRSQKSLSAERQPGRASAVSPMVEGRGEALSFLVATRASTAPCPSRLLDAVDVERQRISGDDAAALCRVGLAFRTLLGVPGASSGLWGVAERLMLTARALAVTAAAVAGDMAFAGAFIGAYHIGRIHVGSCENPSIGSSN